MVFGIAIFLMLIFFRLQLISGLIRREPGALTRAALGLAKSALGSFLAICAAAIVWFSLLIRKALILVAVVMAPIALSGQSRDATKGWFGKWASFVFALVFSKLAMVVAFLVAINQVNAPIDMDLSSIADPVAGIVLMFIAAFVP